MYYSSIQIEHGLITFQKHKVPALQLDDGTVITESVVICKYFCQIAKEQSLYPGMNSGYGLLDSPFGMHVTEHKECLEAFHLYPFNLSIIQSNLSFYFKRMHSSRPKSTKPSVMQRR